MCFVVWLFYLRYHENVDFLYNKRFQRGHHQFVPPQKKKNCCFWGARGSTKASTKNVSTLNLNTSVLVYFNCTIKQKIGPMLFERFNMPKQSAQGNGSTFQPHEGFGWQTTQKERQAHFQINYIYGAFWCDGCLEKKRPSRALSNA